MTLDNILSIISGLAVASTVVFTMFDILPAIKRASGKPDRARRTAEGLLNRSLRMLPDQHRARYAEEFRAELRDIPKWRQQVAYGLRLMVRSWSLRRSLKAARQVSGA